TATAVVERPPDSLPNRFRIISLLVVDQFGNFAPQNIGNGSPVSTHRKGVSDAFHAIGITDANGNQLKPPDLAMRAVGQRHRERDPIEAGFDLLDYSHGFRAFRRDWLH